MKEIDRKLKNNGIEFLSSLEGYHQTLKMIHWSTSNKAEHLLTDDIDSSILDYEDSIAESIMGCLNMKYGHGDLKSMLPSAKTLSEMLNELESETNTFKRTLEENDHAGIINIIDDLLTDINKWKYLETFK